MVCINTVCSSISISFNRERQQGLTPFCAYAHAVTHRQTHKPLALIKTFCCLWQTWWQKIDDPSSPVSLALGMTDFQSRRSATGNNWLAPIVKCFVKPQCACFEVMNCKINCYLPSQYPPFSALRTHSRISTCSVQMCSGWTLRCTRWRNAVKRFWLVRLGETNCSVSSCGLIIVWPTSRGDRLRVFTSDNQRCITFEVYWVHSASVQSVQIISFLYILVYCSDLSSIELFF